MEREENSLLFNMHTNEIKNLAEVIDKYKYMLKQLTQSNHASIDMISDEKFNEYYELYKGPFEKEMIFGNIHIYEKDELISELRQNIYNLLTKKKQVSKEMGSLKKEIQEGLNENKSIEEWEVTNQSPIDNGDTGLVVKYDKVPDLVKKMRHVLSKIDKCNLKILESINTKIKRAEFIDGLLLETYPEIINKKMLLKSRDSIIRYTTPSKRIELFGSSK